MLRRGRFMRILIFIEHKYLLDYFLHIGHYLVKQNFNVTIGSPFKIVDKFINSKLMNRQDLKNITDHDVLWLNTDSIDCVENKITVIFTMHAAGYELNRFIPSTRILKRADYLFVARANFQNIPSDSFANLLPVSYANNFCIVPVGYPKIDKIIDSKATCYSNEKNNVIVALTDLRDNDFDTSDIIISVIDIIFKNTEYGVILRPFPSDMTTDIIQNIIIKYEKNSKFKISTGSYVNDFYKSNFMVMVGRQTATTAYTYSYSMDSGVIFINNENKNTIYNECDIGIALRTDFTPGIFLRAMVQIESDEIKSKISLSRKIKLQYYNESLKRISNVFKAIKSNKNIDNSFVFERKCEKFNLEKAQERLFYLCESLEQSSYIVLDYFREWEKSESRVSEVFVENFIQYFEMYNKRAKKDYFYLFKGYFLLYVFNKLYDKVDNDLLKRKLLEISKEEFAKLKNPSKDCCLNMFEVTIKSGGFIDLESENKFSEAMLYLQLSIYYENRNSDMSFEYAERYIKNIFPYDMDLFFKNLRESYVIYGNGDILKILVKYIKHTNNPLPEFLFNKEPSLDYLEGVPFLRMSKSIPLTNIFIISKKSYHLIKEEILLHDPDATFLNEKYNF